MIDIAIMEGYGQTECTTASNVNMPTGFRFGTVGPAIPGIEVRTADDGEILVRGPNVFAGYYKDEEATREVLDDEGWLHTGDIGSIEDGFLTITDRKKDIIVTAQGKNVAPQNIENELKASKYVSQALVIGDRRPYLTALITLDEAETAKLEPKAHGRRLADRGRGQRVQPGQGVVRAGQALRDPSSRLLRGGGRGHAYNEAAPQDRRGALRRRDRRPLWRRITTTTITLSRA